ncbi:MAG TPA: NAD(P)-dependent glycerol-1-phosphate dehydrogenase [Methanocorpusculum sp.]|nr:NAD(P)-dependent glycerol-1-phosphate dehydrogenase [Methanocorpusculum sp.]
MSDNNNNIKNRNIQNECSILKNKYFDKSRWIQLPRDVVVGHDVLSQLPAVVADTCLQGPILVISGKHTMQTIGVRVLTLLTNAGYDATSLIVGEITYEEVTRVANHAKALHSVLIVAVGGGRVIDIAKIISYNLDIQFISVPTAASHDGITSSRASIHTDEGSISVAAHPPLAIVADTGILADAPRRLTVSGYADMISNYTAVLDWDLSNKKTGEKISQYAMALSMIAAELMVERAEEIKSFDENAIWIVMKALFVSGVAMSVAGSSLPSSGGEHKFAHILEQIAPNKVLHGEACGLGAIISMYLHGGNWKKVRDALRLIGAPTTPKELGLTDGMVVDAVLRAHEIRPERYTIFDTGLTEERVRKAVTALYDIQEEK